MKKSQFGTKKIRIGRNILSSILIYILVLFSLVAGILFIRQNLDTRKNAAIIPQMTKEQKIIDNYYRVFLGRTESIESSGFKANVTTLLRNGCKAAAMSFIQSQEFINRGRDTMQDTAYVTLLYRGIFGRDPESAGFAHNLQLLQQKKFTRVSLANAFLGLPEGKLACKQGSVYPIPSSTPIPTSKALPTPTPTQGTINHELPPEQNPGQQGGIPGVNSPKQISSQFNQTNEQFITDMYHVLLNREPDKNGYRDNLDLLKNVGNNKASFFRIALNFQEFKQNSSLQDKTSYVTRLYTYLLKKQPVAQELNTQIATLGDINGKPDPVSWFQLYQNIVNSNAYKTAICPTSYYSYQTPVNITNPSLTDLFAGKAHFNQKTENISLQFHSSIPRIWDQKLPILRDLSTGKYYGYTRAASSGNWFNIFLMTSTDGKNFTEVSPLFNTNNGEKYYDPQISIDYSVCPTQYVMTMECYRPGFEKVASLCTSTSTDPFNPVSWSYPQRVIGGCDTLNRKTGCSSDRSLTASTGKMLIDGNTKYVAWTVIDDGTNANTQDRSGYTSGKKIININQFNGYANGGSSLLSAEKNVGCTSSWDCNYKDAQDWKQEGGKYFLIYNGANNYRCFRPSGDNRTNWWGLSIAQSNQPLGSYTSLPSPIVMAPRKDVCGMSYPVINNIDGELYMYYAYYENDTAMTSKTVRSKLIWN